MDPSWQPVLSAAQRRKQRRLRSWWRHEQQSIAAALATFTLTTQPYGDRRRPGPGRRRARRSTRLSSGRLLLPRRQAHSTLPWTWMTCLPPVAPDQTVCMTCLVHRSGYSGAPCSRSSTTPLCRFSTILSRRWWYSRWKSFVSSFSVGRWLPSRRGTVRSSWLSTCPRSRRTVLRRAWLTLYVNRRWWNSWWKCRRWFPFRRCSGLWSRTLAFQLLVVVELVEVLPVFSQDRVTSMTAEQIVDNPVRPGGAGDLQGFPRGQGSSALSEQIPEFPDPGGGHGYGAYSEELRRCWNEDSLCFSTTTTLQVCRIGVLLIVDPTLHYKMKVTSLWWIWWRCCRPDVHPCRGAEAYSEDHGDSPVAPQHGVRCPCCAGRAGSLVSGSHLYDIRCSLVECRIMDFSGRSQECSVFNSPWFDSGYMHCVSLRGFWTNFTYSTWRWASDRFQGWLDDLKRPFSPHFAAFFALRPDRRECPFFSPRWWRVLRRRGLGGGGDAGSLTLRRSAGMQSVMHVRRWSVPSK